MFYFKLLQENLNNEIIGFTNCENNEESVYYTVTDIQGSITEVYDGSSNLVWKSGYTAFGEIAGEVVDLIDFDGMYTGCDYDAETGLTYHWNRWRSEDGSAFISEDPIRDGTNWYGYAGCNPMVYVDKIGLFASNGFWGPYATEQYNTTPEVGPQQNPNATPQNQTPNITGPSNVQTSLPPTADLSKYEVYTVLKPFEVEKSTIAPYYGKIGLGIQYESPINARTLENYGIITKWMLMN